MSVHQQTSQPVLYHPTASPFVLQRNCACGNHTNGAECADCAKEQGLIQRQSNSNFAPSEVPPVVHDVLRSPGAPLDSDSRSFFEQRFGRDFSNVRVHTDERAAVSAQAVNATAFTVGQHLVFGAGQFAPRSSAGQKLMAHELTHVVQQSGSSSGGSLVIGQPDSVYEREADQISDRVVSASHSHVRSLSSTNTIQRVAPAVGIAALAGKCIVGAIISALLDLAIQAGMHMWSLGEWTLRGMRVDYCSVILSAILGCIGGVVAVKWLEPFISRALGARLAGIAGTLIGRILLFIVNKLAIGLPRWVVKKLLKLGCISDPQAEALAPGVSGGAAASSSGDNGSGEAGAPGGQPFTTQPSELTR